jgi:hypothetical protein
MGKIYRGLFDSKENAVPTTVKKNDFKADIESIDTLSTKSQIYKDAKKLLNNYILLCEQVKSVESIITERYRTVFVDAKIEDMTAEEIAEMMTTKNEFTHSEVKLLEARRSYLKTKYMVELIDNALEALKEYHGDIQYEVVIQLGILGVKMDDIESVMAKKGCNMSASTAYREFVKGVTNFAVLLWGYEAIKNERTEELINAPQISLNEYIDKIA